MSQLPSEVRRSNTATIIYNMMPVGQKGLKEKIGVSRDTIARAFDLLKEHHLVYITGYESSTNWVYPIYAKGDYADAEKPTIKQLRNEVVRRYRAKNREKEKAKCAVYRSKNRALLNEKQKARYKLNRDSLLENARKKRDLVKTKPPATQWRHFLPQIHQSKEAA